VPARQFIPAAPGWVARYVWRDAESDRLYVDYIPVVGWEVDGEDQFDRSALLCTAEGEVVTRREYRPDDHVATCDGVFFDPSKVPGEPELDEDYLRSILEAGERLKAREDRMAAA
jgi:hypothetical protein